MNTICNFPDIDIYLLLFLDLKNTIVVSLISKAQYALISELDHIKQLYNLRCDHKYIYNSAVTHYDADPMHIPGFNIIDQAARYNYMALIQHIHDSVTIFDYTCHAIDYATQYGNIAVLEWFDKSAYQFIYSYWIISTAVKNNQLCILKWFYKSKYKVMWTDALYWAEIYRHYKIEKWLKKHNLIF